MGFQDRDYNRNEYYDDGGYRPGRRGGPMSVTMRLVILNIVFWLVNGLFFSSGETKNLLTGLMAIRPEAWLRPWEYLTYGFAHSPFSIEHLLWNMIGLIMFGYGLWPAIGPGGFGLHRGENVEQRLGRGEFLVFYLLTIMIGGIVYNIVNPTSSAFGASGGVAGVVILYALFYPNKVILLFFVLPVPMWVLGALMVFGDAWGARGYGCGGIAYTIHLAGAAWALFYYFVFARNGRRITDGFRGLGKIFKRKPKLNIYNGPEENSKSNRKAAEEEEFTKQLDEILGRYKEVGEAGLTRKEREFLRMASERYRNKKR